MDSMEGFRSMAQMAMADILQSIKGTKDVVVDRKIASPLNHLTPLDFMRKNDVKNVHILSSSLPSFNSCTNVSVVLFVG